MCASKAISSKLVIRRQNSVIFHSKSKFVFRDQEGEGSFKKVG